MTSRIGVSARTSGHCFPGVHQRFDPHEPLAQLAPRMQVGEILLPEALFDQQRHGQRVANRQRGGRARRRREVHRTRLLGDAAVERHVGGLRQGGVLPAGNRDELRAEAANRREQLKQFVGFPAVGQRDDDVIALDDAQVAVNRFGRVQEERRRAGAAERRRDLVADDAGLAHPRHDDPAGALPEQLDGAIESLVETIDERQNRGGFRFEHLACQ